MLLALLFLSGFLLFFASSASNGLLVLWLSLSLLLSLSLKRSLAAGTMLSLSLAFFSLYQPDHSVPSLKELNFQVQDLYFHWRGPILPCKQVVLVDVDEISLKAIGQWPWPRSDLAKMIASILADGARAVGVDFVFAEPDRLSLKQDNDQLLAAALDHPQVVTAAFLMTESNFSARKRTYWIPETLSKQNLVISAAIIDRLHLFPKLRTAIDQINHIAKIQERCHHQGAVNIAMDTAGTARSAVFLMQSLDRQRGLALQEGSFSAPLMQNSLMQKYQEADLSIPLICPSLSLEMFRIANNYRSIEPAIEGGKRGIQLKDKNRSHFIALDERGDLPLNFFGFGGRWNAKLALDSCYYFPYISAADILLDKCPKDAFKDKYVLIGSTDPTLADLLATPYRPTFPGLEVHATAIANLILNNALIPQGGFDYLLPFFILASAGPFLSLIFAWLPLWLSLLSATCLIGTLPLYGYYAFLNCQIFLSVYTTLSLALISLVLIIVNYLLEGQEKRFVQHLFSEMVSKEILAKLSEDPQGATLNGQRTQVSVLFSDIEGFTLISEKLPPSDLVGLLNDYLTPMTQIILKSGGFIDKFMGDGIMACWGVPYPDSEHAIKACLSCLEQQKQLTELKQTLLRKYGVKINVRMGISSGEVFAALLGSKTRKNFTVLGDNVNLGSRLESACRYFGVKILMTEATYLLAKEVVAARYMGEIVVKGKSHSVSIYELLGLKEHISLEQETLRTQYEKALSFYCQRHFNEASQILSKLTAAFPEDLASQKLAAKTEQYLLHPPPPSWSPILIFDEK